MNSSRLRCTFDNIVGELKIQQFQHFRGDSPTAKFVPGHLLLLEQKGIQPKLGCLSGGRRPRWTCTNNNQVVRLELNCPIPKPCPSAGLTSVYNESSAAS